MAEYLTALLDSPRSRTMGAVPFVSRDTNTGRLRTHGFASEVMRRSVGDAELGELMSSHQARAVASELDLGRQLEAGTHVAFWIGHEFADAAGRLGLSLPLLDADASVETEQGRVRVLPSEEAFARVVTWTEQALRLVIRTRNSAVADLMRQVAHDSDVIRTAVWLTTSKGQMDRTLEWYTRLERDAGLRTNSRTLIQRFESLANLPRFQWTHAYAISGKAGSDHRRVAGLIHQQIFNDSAVVSFGDYLRLQLQPQLKRTPEKNELQVFGQRLVDTKPFWFAREVLATANTAQRLIVDGVRHPEIQQALRMMVDQIRFSFVDTAEATINARLERLIRDPIERSSVRNFETEQNLRRVRYDTRIEDQEIGDTRRIREKIDPALADLLEGA